MTAYAAAVGGEALKLFLGEQSRGLQDGQIFLQLGSIVGRHQCDAHRGRLAGEAIPVGSARDDEAGRIIGCVPHQRAPAQTGVDNDRHPHLICYREHLSHTTISSRRSPRPAIAWLMALGVPHQLRKLMP
jgi:hypothetical protein